MYKRGNNWYSDFVFRGERYVKSHGPVSKSSAKDKDRRFRTNVADGKYKKDRDNPRFEKALAEHMKKVKVECEQSTYERYGRCQTHLEAFFSKRRIDQIENNQVLMRRYVEKRKAEIKEKQMKCGRTEAEVSYTTINRELALMRVMFNVLIRAGKAQQNPVRLVTLFQEVEKERILSDEEEEKLFQAIEKIDKRGGHLKDVVLIGLHTGMRRGEILSLHKEWINLKESVILVPRSQQKRKKKDKRVPINSEIRPVLESLLRRAGENGYLFGNPKTGEQIKAVKKSWVHAIELAGLAGKPGVDRLRIHDLRHTAATRLMRNTGNMKLVAQYLGHTDIRTTARYVHPDDQDLAEAAESLVKSHQNSQQAKMKAKLSLVTH